MSTKYPLTQYADYLKIDDLLLLQEPRSVFYKKPAHEETLFIIVHQVYELWFKQILHELDSILVLFNNELVDEKSMGLVNSRLERIIEIFRVLNDQIAIIETMTPLDFLDFRDMLYPASGFQSKQFRMIENKLGLKTENRRTYNQAPYHESLKRTEQTEVLESAKHPSLFDNVERWLERTPFLQSESFNFWQLYQQTVENLLERDRQVVIINPLLSDTDKERNLKTIASTLEVFSSLFDQESYKKLQESGFFRLSFGAIHGALFISLYRDQPILQMPFKLLRNLQDIDELMTTWRYRHAIMAHRMIGQKIGTGGSSGHQYLKHATESHKVFNDFFNLATFLIPRSELPKLDEKTERSLSYSFSK